MFTDKYIKEREVFYSNFLLEYIEQTNNDDNKEPFDYVFKLFKIWFKETYLEKHHSKKEFVEYIEKMGLKIEKGYVYGIKLNKSNESVNDSNTK